MNQSASSQAILDAIAERCSVRSYQPGKLDESTVQQLLRLAVRAPTALLEETWSFVVLQNKALLKHISDLAKPEFYVEAHRAHLERGTHALDVFANPEFNIFYNAGTLLLICAQPASGPFAHADCWLAAENLQLAAHALGLGSCIIGCALSTLNKPEIKQEIGVPRDVAVVVPLVVGVPAMAPAPTQRQEPRILAWRS